MPAGSIAVVDDGLVRAPSSKPSKPSANDVRLTPELVRQIEDCLRRCGPFGEVRLVLVKGKVRFVKVVLSECAGEAPPDRD